MRIADHKNSNLLFFLLGGIVLIFFLISAYFLISNLNLFSNSRQVHTETDVHRPDEPEKGLERAQLEAKTPHRGTNFSIILNDELGKYQVYFNPSNRQAGETEFRQFLSENGLTIEDFESYYVESSAPI